MEKIYEQAQTFRMKCYRRMMLEGMDEDYAIQDYRAEWHDAQEDVNDFSQYIETHELQPAEEAELLLTIFVGLQIGFRNWNLFQRAEERAFDLLPVLPDVTNTAGNLTADKLRCHLLVYLYAETEDENFLAEIDSLMQTWSTDSLTEEDRYLQEFYLSVQENILC